MKIAVCFSGLIRNYRDHVQNIIRHSLNDNTDVFIHTWQYKDQKIKEAVSYFQYFHFTDTLKPLKLIIDDKEWEEFDIFNKWNIKKEHDTSHSASNYASMYYSILQSNSLKQIFEQKYNFTYDLVVRHRFDFSFKEKIDYSELDPNVLNLLPINRNDGYCDLWAAGNSKIMDIYSSVYNGFNECCENIKLLRPEDMLKYWIDKFGIKINIIDKKYDIK